MKVEIIEKTDNVLEIEFDDKTLPRAILSALQKKKIDAYTYEPHPILETYRLRVEAKDPVKEVKKALETVEAEWDEFSEKLLSEFGPIEREKKKATKAKKTKKK